MWKEIVKVEGPYAFDQVIDRLAQDPLIELDKETRGVKVPLVLDGNPYVFLVRQTEGGNLFEISGNDKKEQALKEINKIFQFDYDFSRLIEHFQGTNLSDLIEQYAGTPLVLEFDLFRCLVKCIIHQQLNLSFAHTLTERFVKKYGFEVEGVWFYPRPETIANLTYDDLKSLQFSGRKAEYIIDTARLIVEGKLNLLELTEMSDEEVMKMLIKIRGIGPWTVQNLLLSGLGRPNLFPKTDIGIKKAIQKYFKLDQKPTEVEMNQFSEGWSPYLSYATLYLWRSIE